jgi:seryl-tRNA synthetase
MRRRFVILIAAVVIVGSACSSSGVAQEEYDSAQSEIAQLQSRIDELEGEVASGESAATDAQAKIDEAQTEAEALQEQIDELEAANEALEATATELRAQAQLVDRAEARAQDAEDQMAAIQAAFDPELADTREVFIASLPANVCGFYTLQAAPTPQAVAQAIENAVSGSPELEIAFKGWDPETTFDLDTLAGVVAECQRVETLTESKGDGFYTVGDEIAAGRWRSTGTGDGCYWARYDSNQDILDNHFGNAGGSMTIRSSDYEVEFDDCGTWEYLGQ